MGDPLLNPPIERYLESLLRERGEVLTEIEARAKREKIPIIGPLCGSLLYQQARSIGARRVFELGSAIGYSTVWLAMAVGEGGEVHYSDGSPERRESAEDYLRRAGLHGRVTFHTGDALKCFAAVEGEFDLVFNDIDKWEYPAALEAAVPRIRDGGLFITDNTLWGGSVASPSDDTWTQAIQQFNRAVAEHPSLISSLVPLRDGFTICLKTASE